MKISTIERSKGVSIIVFFLINILLFGACKQEEPIAPVAGPFEVTHDIPSAVPATGGTYNLTIDASTNGWWITKSENVAWLTINRLYGSAKVTQQLTIKPNTTSSSRVVTLEVKGTNQESQVISIKQEG